VYFVGVSVGATESFRYSIEVNAGRFEVIVILTVPAGTAACVSE
jgi:hypothetical protein